MTEGLACQLERAIWISLTIFTNTHLRIEVAGDPSSPHDSKSPYLISDPQ